MKKQTLLTIAALMVFGLGAGTLAYQQTSGAAKSAMSCCCCKGDSCPMKSGGEKHTMTSDMKNVPVVTGDEGCCGSCCAAKKGGKTS